MLEGLNHRLAQFLSAPPDLSGGAVFFPLALAEWAIFLGPALLVLLWVIGEQEDRRAAVGAGLSAVLALAIARALSSLFFHPRPFMDGLVRNYLHHTPDSSFPSDHATLLFALGFSILVAPPALIRRLWLVPMGLACAVGWARVYLGAHYPLDIAGSALAGAVAAGLMASTPGRRARDAVTGLGERVYALPLDFMHFGHRK